MKSYQKLATIVFFALSPSPLMAQSKAAAGPKSAAPNYCGALAVQFDEAEKDMATQYIDDLTDNSAPRAQLRAININNSYMQAQIAVSLMQARTCQLPSHAPWPNSYFKAALACKNDTNKGIKNAPSCDRESWQSTMPR